MQSAGIYRHPIGNDLRRIWWQSPLALTTLGGILVWAAFPPLGLSFLAWLAPIPWLWLATRPSLAGRRPWIQIWLGGFIPWMMLLEGIRRAHPANNAGLVALSLYLGLYLPAFIAITRIAVARQRVPLAIAAPVAWTGLEVLRGRLLTGFSMGLLSHTQYEFPVLLQVADLFGAYGLSFVMVSFAACIVSCFPWSGQPRRFFPAGIGVLLLATTIGYGLYRIQSAPKQDVAALKVALLQGTRDKLFEIDRERDLLYFREYWELMQQAEQTHPDLDLVIWPEGTFTSLGPEILAEGSLVAPPEAGMSNEEFTIRSRLVQEDFLVRTQKAAQAVNASTSTADQNRTDTYLLVGAETLEMNGDKRRNYNGALLIGPDGKILDRYYKIHAVMFGEYIPFGGIFPWIYRLTPMAQGLSCGNTPASFEMKGLRLSPSICFEVTVPHLIRQAQSSTDEAAVTPDILVNLTDDGWFWGSTVLDLQLACGVFRAIETRRPMLIAANTGISAWIDGNGRLLKRTPKRTPDILYADVHLDGRSTWYCRFGDVPAWLCFAISGAWVLWKRKETSTKK